MAGPTFREVAAAIVTALTDDLAYLKTVRLFIGSAEEIADRAGAFETPAAFVLWDGMLPFEGEGAESFSDRVYEARYSVVCIARGLGGRLAHAEEETYSAHQIVEDVHAALSDSGLGLEDFDTLVPGAVARVRVSPTETAYTVGFSCLVSLARRAQS